MHPITRKTFLAAILFLTSCVIIFLARQAPTHAVGSLIGFILYAMAWAFFFRAYKEEISIMTIFLVPMLSAMIMFIVVLNPSFKLFFILAPMIISLFLGIVAGFLFSFISGKWKFILPAILLLFPLALNYNIYEKWDNKIRYGIYEKNVSDKKIANFELLDEYGKVFGNDFIENKIVLFTFWVQNSESNETFFSDIQDIHDNYGSNPRIDVYAINKPQTSDAREDSFSIIKEQGYSFPLLKGSQTVMELFQVRAFPSVLLINETGTIVYKGDLKGAATEIEQLLNK